MTSRTGKPLLSAPGKVKSLDDFTDLFLREFLKKAVEAFRKQTKQNKKDQSKQGHLMCPFEWNLCLVFIYFANFHFTENAVIIANCHPDGRN